MEKRPIRLARELADQGIDSRRRSSVIAFITALLAIATIGLLRMGPAFASDEQGAAADRMQEEAVTKYDNDGEDSELALGREGDGTNRDKTGGTGGTGLTDGTGRHHTGWSGNTKGTVTDGAHTWTGRTGNTGTQTDGGGDTGKTGNTETVTDGGAATGRTGNTNFTDGTGETFTGRTGDTGGCTDGEGDTGQDGNTGTVTDGGGHTGATGETFTATDGGA